MKKGKDPDIPRYTRRQIKEAVPERGVRRPTEFHHDGVDYYGTQAAVVARQGSGKNEVFYRPLAYDVLMNRPQHLILNDPKDEERGKLIQAGALPDYFYYSLEPGDNPVSSINPIPDQRTADKFLNGLYAPHKAEGNAKFFALAAKALAKGLIEQSGYAGLVVLHDMLLDPSEIERAARTNPKVRLYFEDQSQATRASIIGSAHAPLEQFAQPEYRRMFAPGGETPVFKPERRDVVLFRPPSTQRAAETAQHWLNLVYDYVFELSCEGYNRYRDQGAPGTFNLLDEMASIMKVEGLQGMLNIGRGQGQRMVIVLQGLSQLYDRLGRDSAHDVLGSIDLKLFGRAGDHRTRQYVSEESGTIAEDQAVRDDAHRGKWTQRFNDAAGKDVHRTQRVQVPLLAPEELGTLKKFQMFIFDEQGNLELNTPVPWFMYEDRIPVSEGYTTPRVRGVVDPEVYALKEEPPEIPAPPVVESHPEPEPEPAAATRPEAPERGSAAQPAEVGECWDCGHPIPEKSRFCPDCGIRLAPDPKPEPDPPASPTQPDPTPRARLKIPTKLQDPDKPLPEGGEPRAELLRQICGGLLNQAVLLVQIDHGPEVSYTEPVVEDFVSRVNDPRQLPALIESEVMEKVGATVTAGRLNPGEAVTLTVKAPGQLSLRRSQ